MNSPRVFTDLQNSSLSGRLLALTLLVLSCGTLQAQLLEEVVVTAQKREQNLQDVGVSVTAFSGDQMQKLGFVESKDIIAQTPGLELLNYGGGSIVSFNIRGVGQNDFLANQEAPVALYVDEAYQPSNVTTRFSLFDIDRTEILRGPQGTLFGRNSTGGLVHFVTAKPTEEVDGFVDVTLGEESRRRVEAAIGGGLTETVSGRLSMVYNGNNGLIENDIGPDQREADDYAVRGQLQFDPSDDLSILLKAQYADESSAAVGYSHGLPSFNPTDFFGYVDADGDPFTASNDFEGQNQTEVLDLYAKIEWDVGNFTVTSITNYQDVDTVYAEDSDASPNSLYHYTQFYKMDQISQELRLSWEGDRHRSVVGFYYLNIDGDYDIDQAGDAFFGPGAVFAINSTQETTTFAFFGQTEFDITEQLSLTAGLRYNNDDKDFSLVAPDFGFGGYTDNLSEEDFNAKIQLNYRVNDDWLLYAGYNRGIKSGGFNVPLTPVTTAELPYGGEVLTAYEIGFKASLTETTRLNASVYYYDYDDYQAYNIDPFFNAFLFNAQAENYGAEIELVTNPIDGLDILLGASFLDTKITDLPTTFNTLDPVTFAPAQNFPTGTEEAPLSPGATINGLVRYSWPAFGGTVALQGDFRWTDDQKFNLAVSELVLEDDYVVFNARLDYTTSDERWSAAIFVKNLTDTEYREYSTDATLFFGSGLDVWGNERWVGGNVRYNFF